MSERCTFATNFLYDNPTVDIVTSVLDENGIDYVIGDRFVAGRINAGSFVGCRLIADTIESAVSNKLAEKLVQTTFVMTLMYYDRVYVVSDVSILNDEKGVIYIPKQEN